MRDVQASGQQPLPHPYLTPGRVRSYIEFMSKTQTVTVRKGSDSVSYTTVIGTGTVWTSHGQTMNLIQGQTELRELLTNGWKLA